MAERNAGTVAIRLDLRGQEELKRRLEELGPAGTRVFRDLENAAKPVSSQFRLVDRARKDLGEGFQDLAREAGPVGRLFTAIPGWGIAAAAGIGLLTVAVREFFELMERASATADFAERLETVQRAAGVTEQRVLAMGSAVQLAGGDFQSGLNGLEEFSKRLGELRTTGQGEGRDAFDALGLGALGASEAPVEEVLDRVLERLSQIEDPSRRLSLADKLGLRDAAPLLQQSADEIGRILTAANDVNAAFSSDVLGRFADAATTLHELQLRQERARQLQSLAGLDAEVARQRVIAEFEEAKARLLQERLPIERQSRDMLEEQAARHDEVVASLQNRLRLTGLDAEQRARIRTELRTELRTHTEITAELERRSRLTSIEEMREQRRQQELSRRAIGRPEVDPGPDPMTAERRRELESLIEQSLRAIQTPLQRVAALEADLNEAREGGLEISEQQIANILAHQRASLGLTEAVKSLTDEERKLQGALASQIDPLEQQKALLESLIAPIEQAEARLLSLYAVLAQSPEHADIIIAEIERAKGAIDGGDGSVAGLGGRAAETRFSGLRKMAEDAVDADRQLDDFATGSLSAVNRNLLDVITNAQSAGEAFENMKDRILSALAEILLQQAVIGPLANLGSSLLSTLIGVPSVKAGVRHTGGATDGSGPHRDIPLSMLAGAPRYHNGTPGTLGSDEHVFIGKDGERVLNPSENTALLRLLDQAVAGGGGRAPIINFHGAPEGSRAEAREVDGSWVIDAFIAQARVAGAEGAAAQLAAMTGDLPGMLGAERDQRG
ncbi:hypothetical protein [Maricaulis sp.]|uniref:hypothetical protein n=1 Tax=Maricaulis sp. TaxID=1486257 RepID=UPI003A90C2FF